jgi:hypothetical protein
MSLPKEVTKTQVKRSLDSLAFPGDSLNADTSEFCRLLHAKRQVASALVRVRLCTLAGEPSHQGGPARRGEGYREPQRPAATRVAERAAQQNPIPQVKTQQPAPASSLASGWLASSRPPLPAAELSSSQRSTNGSWCQLEQGAASQQRPSYCPTTSCGGFR